MQPYISLDDIKIIETTDEHGNTILTTPGYDITTTIQRDDHYESQWALDWDRVGTIFIDSSKWSLGDEQGEMPEPVKICEDCGGSGDDGPDEFCDLCDGEGFIETTLEDHIKREENAIVVLFLDLYDNWQPSISIAEGEDGADGYVYTTRERAAEILGDDFTIEQVKDAMKAEVEHYSHAIQGDVWRYEHSGSELRYGDNCNGFVGADMGDSGAMYEATCSHKGEVSAAYKERYERQYWLDRGVPTIG